ncbi:MAG: DUF4347 domain-containing protein, partial [Spirulina sp. SIO3F2]|nr:DUF4347 domain-containing protein [Spirulina sp. SIO3F2]
MLKTWLQMGSFLILPFTLTAPTFAQSITAAPDGTDTIVNYNGNTYHIQGGTQAGANLFHSFQALGLSNGEIANFLSNPSITNIFGRVTGGAPSIIDGLIQVTGANSNLYLMNPAGIVFGQGASLNVGGDFTATTADRIGFAGGWFNATGANDYAALVGAPNQFAFLSEQPGSILNFGDLSTENNVSLVGGTVLNQGQVVSRAGSVTLAAVPGERLVKLSQPGMLLSLEVTTEAITAEISSLDLPELLTGSGQTIVPSVQFGDVVIVGEVQGENIDLYAASQVEPTDAALIQGDTRVIRFSDTGENPNQAVFIDAWADNSTDLLFGAEAGTVAQIIEQDQHGITAISEQLAVISDSVGKLDSVAIVAEGNEGNFWLGNQWIRTENISDYAAQLQGWGEALTENADLLLYSCFTALGGTGEALVQQIADLTGADVAASVDATGSVNYGGDWVLEQTTGEIEATSPFTDSTLTAWDGKLAMRTVTSLLDDNSGGTLRAEIAAASAGDFITFGVVGTVILNGTEIVWGTDNLTIDGNGSVVDGNYASRVFRSTANTVTIRDLTIQRGSVSGNAGGITHNGTGIVTLDNVQILNNVANTTAGVRSINGSVVLNNSLVSGNSAATNRGGIRAANNLTIIDSTISDNTAGNNVGGAIAYNVTLINSTVTGNSAGNNGGGIQNNYSGGSVTLINSTVTGNSAGSHGGGIRTFGVVNLNLTNSTVTGNSAGNNGGGISANSITLNSSTLSGNLAGSNGGGINVNDEATLNSSTVSGNFAGNAGGGINAGGAIYLTHSMISGNSANLNGGGIKASDTVTLSDSTVLGNSASNNGGGINANGAASLFNTTISNNGAGSAGGGIYASDSLTLHQSTVAGNSAGLNGGGIKAGDTVSLSSSTVSGNSTSNNGGGINANGAASLFNTTISRNGAGNQGGGIFATAPITLTNATIAFNTANGGGGGIRLSSIQNNQIANTIIANNTDTSGGNTPNISANLSSSTVQYSLLTSTAGITGLSLTDGVNGNIIDKDPKLGPLQNNGGPTQTHALRLGSPAINAGKNALALDVNGLMFSIDQAGYLRIFDGTVDIGAYELQDIDTTNEIQLP